LPSTHPPPPLLSTLSLHDAFRSARTMATTPTIDLDALLAPIPGDNPSGRSLVYEPEYDAIREARRAEDDTLQGEWKREAKAADRSEEHTSELQSLAYLVCRLLLE